MNLICPHCAQTLTEAHIRSLNGKLNVSKRTRHGGRPAIRDADPEAVDPVRRAIFKAELEKSVNRVMVCKHGRYRPDCLACEKERKK